LGDKHQLLDLGLWYSDLGIVFYPFISGYIMLENIGFFDRIKKYNWTAVITYTIIALMGYLWIIYVVKPLVLIISGNIID
jgi:hypothetical protein